MRWLFLVFGIRFFSRQVFLGSKERRYRKDRGVSGSGRGKGCSSLGGEIGQGE